MAGWKRGLATVGIARCWAVAPVSHPPMEDTMTWRIAHASPGPGGSARPKRLRPIQLFGSDPSPRLGTVVHDRCEHTDCTVGFLRTCPALLAIAARRAQHDAGNGRRAGACRRNPESTRWLTGFSPHARLGKRSVRRCASGGWRSECSSNTCAVRVNTRSDPGRKPRLLAGSANGYPRRGSSSMTAARIEPYWSPRAAGQCA